LTTFSLTICERFSTTLVNLSLEQNKLTSFPLTLPATITFTSLKTLNLSSNRLSQLSHDPAATATHFPVLAELDLTNNNLTDLPTGLSTQILPALRTLRCNSNRLGALDPASVVNVEVLDIGNNDIAVLPPALGLNSSLRELTAYGNRFRVPQPSLLAQGTPAVMAFLKRRAGVATD
jgi:Leucine-rich repeat (LRR) protein